MALAPLFPTVIQYPTDEDYKAMPDGSAGQLVNESRLKDVAPRAERNTIIALGKAICSVSKSSE